MSAKDSTARKAKSQPQHIQAVEKNPYIVALNKLGLDPASINELAEGYLSHGDDEHLVLTIVVLQRLSNLAIMRKDAPESLENLLPQMIDAFYSRTSHCGGAAHRFAMSLDRDLLKRKAS
jgi:hypothetical protein